MGKGEKNKRAPLIFRTKIFSVTEKGKSPSFTFFSTFPDFFLEGKGELLPLYTPLAHGDMTRGERDCGALILIADQINTPKNGNVFAIGERVRREYNTKKKNGQIKID